MNTYANPNQDSFAEAETETVREASQEPTASDSSAPAFDYDELLLRYQTLRDKNSELGNFLLCSIIAMKAWSEWSAKTRILDSPSATAEEIKAHFDEETYREFKDYTDTINQHYWVQTKVNVARLVEDIQKNPFYSFTEVILNALGIMNQEQMDESKMRRDEKIESVSQLMCQTTDWILEVYEVAGDRLEKLRKLCGVPIKSETIESA